MAAARDCFSQARKTYRLQTHARMPCRRLVGMHTVCTVLVYVAHVGTLRPQQGTIPPCAGHPVRQFHVHATTTTLISIRSIARYDTTRRQHATRTERFIAHYTRLLAGVWWCAGPAGQAHLAS
jgi:hypothetical protein